jgi:hypothetical protein
MKKTLFLLLFPVALIAQPKGLADDLYEEYEPKPYIGGFSFGGSLLSALPLDIDFANGDLERTLNGEIKRVQWLRVSDDRYRKEVTKDWQKFLDRAGYKKVELEEDNGEVHYLYFRGSRTRFDEAHFLVTEESNTILITFYGNFTLSKTLHED